MRVAGILAAAGSGERLGTREPKAFAECAGRPLLVWSLEVLLEACDSVVVAVPPGASLAWSDAGDTGLRAPAVAGGATRSESVRIALQEAGEADVVVVHDAARPLVTRELVDRCVDAVSEGWDGAVAAAPVTDTIKEADPADLGVVRTLDRSRLWAIQTPQVFPAPVLRRALDVDDAALAAATDDASLVEAAGGRVRVVEAPPDNIKVTHPADLERAEVLLRARAAVR